MSGEFETPVRDWRRLIIIGLFFIIAGITIFLRPKESYLTLNSLFSVVLIFSGVNNIITSDAGQKKRQGKLEINCGYFRNLNRNIAFVHFFLLRDRSSICTWLLGNVPGCIYDGNCPGSQKYEDTGLGLDNGRWFC
jgi:uncharacterized membrane protein HdeD (DUF308 family)